MQMQSRRYATRVIIVPDKHTAPPALGEGRGCCSAVWAIWDVIASVAPALRATAHASSPPPTVAGSMPAGVPMRSP